ncbi:hypothetical protein [Bifidobacterium thermacidophilum]|uniref:hypothetical protein n=1 Tax=Bifidobacterium thermacidophilum TaxID=246618 RepID=UPI00186BB723|nr:hypothetical protein [Bifidobacterium thermacidophilum]
MSSDRQELRLLCMDVEFLVPKTYGIPAVAPIACHTKDIDIEMKAGIKVPRRNDQMVKILDVHG